MGYYVFLLYLIVKKWYSWFTSHYFPFQDLIDEHAQGIMSRILTKLFQTADFFRDNITKDQLLPVLSVVATILLIVAVGYILSYLV